RQTATLFAMSITRTEIIEEIKKFVVRERRSPGEREFVAATRIKQSAWKGKYWARWTDAVREAGHEPNSMTQKIPEADLIKQLAEFVVDLGHFPVRDEINMQARQASGFPVWQTIKKRYGGMPETAKALLEFANETGNTKLADLCKRRIDHEASKPAPSPNGQTSAKPRVGYVYLKYSRSLRLYKIGKANDSERRGAGISLLLPEDLVPKHQIRTDCPYILEKYWHSRFRTKRKQGEWFELNTSDVEAFKTRREFMFCEFFP
ncbi:MAG: GIY-YIG nuclease family protein, partial [Pirellulales bacterium]